jgi:hypothetical protein
MLRHAQVTGMTMSQHHDVAAIRKAIDRLIEAIRARNTPSR